MSENYFQNKKILVTGGTGLIGIPLVKKLMLLGAKVRVVSLDKECPDDFDVEFINGDLCEKDICAKVLRNIQVVFHLAGIKGGVGVVLSRASTFLVKNILMNVQIMEASRKAGVERFLYTSSICIYPPREIFKEEDAWVNFPHPSDKFGGMAKLIGEMQIEAYKLQYDLENFLIARPANTYGPYDNFNSASALVIPALINRIFKRENPLIIWGDGSSVRDFIFSEDVADFLILMVERNTSGPFNVGSGAPVSIRTVAETIVKYAEKFIGEKINIKWDTAKPTGEKYRVASMKKTKTQLGWSAQTDLDTGISRTLEWYNAHFSNIPERYNVLSED